MLVDIMNLQASISLCTTTVSTPQITTISQRQSSPRPRSHTFWSSYEVVMFSSSPSVSHLHTAHIVFLFCCLLFLLHIPILGLLPPVHNHDRDTYLHRILISRKLPEHCTNQQTQQNTRNRAKEEHARMSHVVQISDHNRPR